MRKRFRGTRKVWTSFITKLSLVGLDLHPCQGRAKICFFVSLLVMLFNGTKYGATVYMLIKVKFGIVQYTMGSPSYATFGLYWMGVGTRAPNLKICQNHDFSAVFVAPQGRQHNHLRWNLAWKSMPWVHSHANLGVGVGEYGHPTGVAATWQCMWFLVQSFSHACIGHLLAHI